MSVRVSCPVAGLGRRRERVRTGHKPDAGRDADGEFWRPSALCLPVAHATGSAGDVFLCHPFLVHTATWPHRGTAPRMIAQPAVHVAAGFAVDGSDPSPVARAIVAGLARGR